ncbi:zinc transporter ZIP6 isoform X1 [Lingula anatina]|uniref:Zinc transporter ZIP6 isoform X1 n=1 Tax=Lingula anatina TaxID=7574 RepID=A0A1S3H1B3_LINAN|nr:zinc transporter ZIP6 isoform X1 [Lingula anatina]|eukprot:XP_013379925.1 zinc transporter ZIP6 isoform X1 [Lingula anatina]
MAVATKKAVMAFLMLTFVAGFAIKAHCEETTANTVDKALFIDSLFEALNVTTENGTLSEEAFEALLTKLKIGAVSGGETGTIVEGGGGHDGHDHRRKKRDTHSSPLQRKKRATGDPTTSPSASAMEEDHEHEAVEKCFNGEDLLTVFGVDHEAGVTRAQFTDLCPALIQQQITGACSGSPANTTKANTKASSTAEMYGYGSLAVFIISLLAIGGVFLIPCMGHTAYQYVMETFIALAVGTMAGDALLHLIPQSLGLHGHDAEAEQGHNHSDINNITVDNYVWYTSTVLLALYAFFLLETVMGMLGGGHNHSHMGPDKKPEIVHKEPVEADFAHTDEVIRRSFRRKKNKELKQSTSVIEFADKEGKLKVPSVRVTDENGFADKMENGVENGHAVSLPDVKVTTEEPEATSPPRRLSITKEIDEEEEENVACYKKIKTVVWMTLIGDTIHNMADGMAVGAAFAASVSSGIATAIAVFFHELPHELGDFAILLTGGFNFKQAVLCNFLSALASFIGLFIGIAIAIDGATRSWIFAITAGMFLYISLVDMLPELINMKAPGNKCISFLLQNLGILFGFGTMLCLSVFEDYIQV